MQLSPERAVARQRSLATPGTARDRRERLRVTAAGIAAALLGAAPHVLHHGGPLAGAAILGGAGGSLLFGAVGFLLAIPLLVRAGRRTGSWKVPAGLLALFAVVFTLSTAVLGPAITASDDAPVQSTPDGTPSGDPSGHEKHHD